LEALDLLLEDFLDDFLDPFAWWEAFLLLRLFPPVTPVILFSVMVIIIKDMKKIKNNKY